MKKIALRFVLCFIAVVLLLGFSAGVIFRKSLTIAYIVNTYVPAKRLPDRWIIPALKYVIDGEFHVRISDAEGIFEGGRDPSILVRCHLDPNDMDLLVARFAQGATVVKVDCTYLERVQSSGHSFFPTPMYWQKKYGYEVFDINSLGVGVLIEYDRSSRGHTVYVDKENQVAYIYAYNN